MPILSEHLRGSLHKMNRIPRMRAILLIPLKKSGYAEGHGGERERPLRAIVE